MGAWVLAGAVRIPRTLQPLTPPIGFLIAWVVCFALEGPEHRWIQKQWPAGQGSRFRAEGSRVLGWNFRLPQAGADFYLRRARTMSLEGKSAAAKKEARAAAAQAKASRPQKRRKDAKQQRVGPDGRELRRKKAPNGGRQRAFMRGWWDSNLESLQEEHARRPVGVTAAESWKRILAEGLHRANAEFRAAVARGDASIQEAEALGAAALFSHKRGAAAFPPKRSQRRHSSASNLPAPTPQAPTAQASSRPVTPSLLTNDGVIGWLLCSNERIVFSSSPRAALLAPSTSAAGPPVSVRRGRGRLGGRGSRVSSRTYRKCHCPGTSLPPRQLPPPPAPPAGPPAVVDGDAAVALALVQHEAASLEAQKRALMERQQASKSARAREEAAIAAWEAAQPDVFGHVGVPGWQRGS